MVTCQGKAPRLGYAKNKVSDFYCQALLASVNLNPEVGKRLTPRNTKYTY